MDVQIPPEELLLGRIGVATRLGQSDTAVDDQQSGDAGPESSSLKRHGGYPLRAPLHARFASVERIRESKAMGLAALCIGRCLVTPLLVILLPATLSVAFADERQLPTLP